MQVDIETLREQAQKTEETKEVVEGATGGASESVGPGTQSAIAEFKEQMRARQELEQLITEERGPSLTEGIAEFLKDPDARAMLKELWFGPGEGQTQRQPQRQPQETPSKQPDSAHAGADTQDMTQTPDLDMDTDTAYNMLITILGGIAESNPDMTASEMSDFAMLLNQVTTNVAQQKPDMNAEQMVGYAENYEGLLKRELEQLT